MFINLEVQIYIVTCFLSKHISYFCTVYTKIIKLCFWHVKNNDFTTDLFRVSITHFTSPICIDMYLHVLVRMNEKIIVPTIN